MNFYERLTQLREEKGISIRAMEREAGISNGVTAKWGIDSKPNVKQLEKLAEFFQVSTDYLLGRSDYRSVEELADAVKRFENGKMIPIYESVDPGELFIQDAIDFIEFKDCNEKTHFGLQIQDDSMAPEINKMDVVIVRKTKDATTNDLVIASINGDDGICRKLILKDTGFYLQPINPNYEPIYFSNENDSCVILGKIQQVLRGV